MGQLQHFVKQQLLDSLTTNIDRFLKNSSALQQSDRLCPLDGRFRHLSIHMNNIALPILLQAIDL